ncbi:hypothetical protein A4G20_00850 [Pasteurellaceae bacterium RH1A]|nr:hypothetical protein A4G20_00850 [Pasteurellaceae bacterium RH1A]
MKKMTKTLIASALTFTAAGASAAAFQLAEVSTSGLGLAYAGNAAVADNASVVATNPALMTKFKRAEISAGGTLIDTNVDVEGKTALNVNPLFGSDASHKNIIPTAFVPNLYVVVPVNDRFALGGGVNVNYGLKSEFGQTYNAGVFAGKTDLTALNLNLSGAYELGYGFSFGLGLNAVYAKAELERHAGDTSLLYNMTAGAALTNNSTTVSRMKGDDWGFGWNVGLTYDINEGNRIGVAYHSPVKLRFKGQFSNQLPLVLGGTAGAELPGSLGLELPAYWEVSTFHKLTDKLAFQFSYKRTDWSSFQELRATGSNGAPLLQKDEKFSDNSRVAVGLSYDVNPALTLRTGVAFDETASVEHPSISIPDTDRTWYTVGATYRFTPNLSVDLAYAHLRGSKSSFTESQRLSNGATYSADVKVKSSANIYGLNLNYKF